MSQRICKTLIFEEQLIYVQRGNTGKNLEEWPVIIQGECLMFLFKDGLIKPNLLIFSILYKEQK